MKNWIAQRIDWLNTHIPGTATGPVTGPITGIEDAMDLNKFSFSLGPVPFQDLLTIYSNTLESGTVKFQWHDLQGKKISEGDYHQPTTGPQQHEINSRQFSKGVYIIKLQFENGPAFIRKVVKN